jgi:hypothetical protein
MSDSLLETAILCFRNSLRLPLIFKKAWRYRSCLMHLRKAVAYFVNS